MYSLFFVEALCLCMHYASTVYVIIGSVMYERLDLNEVRVNSHVGQCMGGTLLECMMVKCELYIQDRLVSDDESAAGSVRLWW